MVSKIALRERGSELPIGVLVGDVAQLPSGIWVFLTVGFGPPFKKKVPFEAWGGVGFLLASLQTKPSKKGAQFPPHGSGLHPRRGPL